MPVYIVREAEGVVAEPLRDHIQRDLSLASDRDVRVPQIVEPDRRDSACPNVAGELVRDPAEIERGAVSRRKTSPLSLVALAEVEPCFHLKG
jgi:hypothetical protein